MKHSDKNKDMLDNRGALKTELLFAETIKTDRLDRYEPIYTLKEDDTDLPSAYKLYMESADEYEAAMKIVGSMRHWRRLCGLKWFMEGIPVVGFEGLLSWRKDMKMRDKSRAKQLLMQSAEKGNASAQRALYFDETAAKRVRKKEAKADASNNDRMNNIREIFGKGV